MDSERFSSEITHLARKKSFYDSHMNFAGRTPIDCKISPGTKAKYQIIQDHLGKKHFSRALDVGCSGNSFIYSSPHMQQRIFVDLAHLPLKSYLSHNFNHPTVGTITNLPFNDYSFDLITALDVIEHIKNDQIATKELIRVLAPKGYLVVSVPHQMRYYTQQDSMIGHYRRYEMSDLTRLFVTEGHLKEISVFGVYGQAMKSQFFQKSNPEKTEQGLKNLRSKYRTNPIFRRIWDKIVAFGAFWMKLDARFQPLKKIMNVCVIYQKNSP